MFSKGERISPVERRFPFALALLFSFSLIFGAACIVAYKSYTKATDAAIHVNGTRATLLAKLILEHQRAAIGVLRSYAGRPLLIDSIQRRDFEGALRHLIDMVKNNPEVERPFIANPDSTIWVNYPVSKEVFNKDLSGRDWYKGVSRERKPYISSVFKMVVGEKNLAVAVSAPIFDEKGKLIGILSTAQSTPLFRKVLDEVSPNSDVHVTLIDQEGHIIYSNRFPYSKEVIDYPPLDFVGRAKKREKGDVEIQDFSDENRAKYVSFAPVGEIGWSIIVEKSKRKVLRSEYLYFVLIAAISFLMFAVVVLSLIYLRARQRQIKGLEELNEELDGRVRKRTAELEVTNQSLSGEIAERKRAEEEIRKLNEQLSRKALDLELANKELDSFTSAVSHDLKNQLIVISAFTGRLFKRHMDKLDAKGQEYVGMINSSVENMITLVGDLLELSRISRAKMRAEPLDLSELVWSVLKKYQEKDPERKVEVVVSKKGEARGDRRLLTVVLDNLLNNAWKYTKNSATSQIEFGVTQESEEPIFFIRDNGCGFTVPADPEQIFLPFTRFHVVEDYPGTGVGLATVKRIISRHGGKIWVESSIGKGTVFYFTLQKIME